VPNNAQRERRHSALRHRSLLSDNSEVTSNTHGGPSVPTSTQKVKLTAYQNLDEHTLANNERLLSIAKDLRRKTIIGQDTANVLQELADSQISKLRESNQQLSQTNLHAQSEIQRCHDQIARQASANHSLQLQLEACQ